MAKVTKDLKELDLDVVRLKKLVSEAQPTLTTKDKEG